MLPCLFIQGLPFGAQRGAFFHWIEQISRFPGVLPVLLRCGGRSSRRPEIPAASPKVMRAVASQLRQSIGSMKFSSPSQHNLPFTEWGLGNKRTAYILFRPALRSLRVHVVSHVWRGLDLEPVPASIEQ